MAALVRRMQSLQYRMLLHSSLAHLTKDSLYDLQDRLKILNSINVTYELDDVIKLTLRLDHQRTKDANRCRV